MLPSLPRFYTALLLALGLLFFPLSASAQQVLVGDADTVRVTNGGVWDLQGATMDFGGPDTTAALVETDSARVTGGLLEATRTLSGPQAVDVAGLGAVLSAGANLGDVTVTRGHTVQTAANGNESIERYYDIEPSKNNSGLSATLVHTYKDPELNNRTESQLELFKQTNGSWEEKGVDSRDAQANTVTLSGIESFSRWTLGSASNPLPVEMAGFEGTRTEDGVRLTWQTASETNNAGFRVQRTIGVVDADGNSDVQASRRDASPGEDWQTVGHVDGSGTTTETQTYRFTDDDLPYAADTLAYRLKQVDADGSATTTDPVPVARGGIERLQLKKTFPNPARSRVTVRYAVPEGTEAEAVTMQLYDVLGRQVRTVTPEAKAGRHEQQLSVQNLASGVYVLRLRAAGDTQIRQLTVVK
jgi:hypothetical protein